MPKKKKILFHSNHSRILSGFGKNARNILRHLAKTGKYDIVEFANGVSWGHDRLETLPWKAIGSLPNDKASIDKINKDPNAARSASYGSLTIDKVIKQEKPDIYIGVEDIWGFNGFHKKNWWNKINSIIWTTLDSLPILPDAIEFAKKTKHYYVWSSFAEEALSEEGQGHVKTLHGSVDHNNFFKHSFEERAKLREIFGIDQNSFVVGFVFRNQLRKSVPNLLEGFNLFKQRNPDIDAKLLLHAHWSEGWDIPRLIKEKGLDPQDILCTYFCKKCKKYEVKPFIGQKQNCKFCGTKESQNTVTIADGVSEEQLNEVYNLMDVYCHPFTSGGQELPIQEAKLTELITLVTDYSCGKDSCSKESGGIPLGWSEYREPGTQFIKASTHAESIYEELVNVYKMDALKKSSVGKKSRDYVINNYSVEIIGKKLEDIFDNMPKVEWDFDFSSSLKNSSYLPPEIEDNKKWLIDIYKNILDMDVDELDQGHKHWMNAFKNGGDRGSILKYFHSVAEQENRQILGEKEVSFDSFLDKNENKRALFVLEGKEEDILLVSSLFKSFKESHQDYDIYFACGTKYRPILQANPYIHKVLPFTSELESEFLMIGAGQKEEDRYFHYYCNFGILTQKHINYHGLSQRLFNLDHE